VLVPPAICSALRRVRAYAEIECDEPTVQVRRCKSSGLFVENIAWMPSYAPVRYMQLVH